MIRTKELLPQQKMTKSAETALKKQRRKEKAQAETKAREQRRRRSKSKPMTSTTATTRSSKGDPEVAFRNYERKNEAKNSKKKKKKTTTMTRTRATKKASKRSAPPPKREFRSFSDSSDYSDTDFEGSYISNEDDDTSSVYSDPGFPAVSYNDDSNNSNSNDESGSEDLEFDSSRSSSEDDSSYTSNEDETTIEGNSTVRTERSAWKRNPEAANGGGGGSGNNRSPSRVQTQPVATPRSSGHISSPRSSPRKRTSMNDSAHIHSPRRSARGGSSTITSTTAASTKKKQGFFHEDDDDECSDESSYASGTSYDSEDDDDDDDSDASDASGSSYSDSLGGSETNDEYYTTSYDDHSRNLRDSTFSASWTDGPLTTYGSEETEQTKPRDYNYGSTLLTDVSCSRSSLEEDSQTPFGESRSSALIDSRDLGSINEIEYDEFVKEQQAAEKVEEERAAAKKALEEQQGKGGGGGVFSWIFGGSTPTEDKQQPETIPKKKEPQNEAGNKDVVPVEDTKDNNKDKHKGNLVALSPTSPARISRKEKELQLENQQLQRQEHISSPPYSPRSIKSEQSILSPRSTRSPRSTASSRNDFIVRNRRSAIFLECDTESQPDEIDQTMSPGCSVHLEQMLIGGDSMPGSYGGLKDGEFLLSNHESMESSDTEEPSKEEGTIEAEDLSVTMRGSGSFEVNEEEDDDNKSYQSKKTDAPLEIAFSSPSPGVTSPLSKSGRPVVLKAMTDETEGERSFLYFCCSPDNSVAEEALLPPSGAVVKEFNRAMAAAAENEIPAYAISDDAISALLDDEGNEETVIDDTTCASTINTEGFRELRDAQMGYTAPKSESPVLSLDQEADGEKSLLQDFIVPFNTTDEQHQDKDDKDNEALSCEEERIELELGPYMPVSFEDTNTEVLEEDDAESAKRIQAESLENYDSSDILHGRRCFKSKTGEDGLPIPAYRPSSPAGRRERRKIALKAHRDFLYKSRSIDSAPKEDTVDTNAVSDCEDGDNTSTGGERKTKPIDSSSTGPSILSNSIVQEDSSILNGNKPDALMELVLNAFNVIMAPNNDDIATSNSGAAPTDVGTSKSVQEGNIKTLLPSSGPMDGMLEMAFSFFAPTIVESSAPLITEPQNGQEESLMCSNYNPNPGVHAAMTTEVKPKVAGSSKKAMIVEGSNSSIAESKESPSTGVSSSSLYITNLSDEAVNYQPKTASPIIATADDDSRFNADGIPLTLSPKKIWRAFDSGFSVNQSVATTTGTSLATDIAHSDASTEPKSNKHKERTEKIPVQAGISSDKLDSILLSVGDGNEESAAKEGCEDGTPQNSDAAPNLQIDEESETQDAIKEESGGMRLSTSPRYRRRNELKRMKTLRTQPHYKDSVGSENVATTASTNGHDEDSGSGLLSPRKERCKTSEKRRPKMRSCNSPTRQRHERNHRNNKNKINPNSRSPMVAMEERRDAIAIAIDAAHDQNTIDRTPPSPIQTTRLDGIRTEGGVAAGAVASPANIADIRARIKQRQRSKFRKQQQQHHHHHHQKSSQKPTIDSIECKEKSFPSSKHPSNETNVVQVVAADRRDDNSFSEEFFDAISIDEGDDTKDSKNKRKPKTTPARAGTYMVPVQDERDRVLYPGLSYKESILSGAMSLD